MALVRRGPRVKVKSEQPFERACQVDQAASTAANSVSPGVRALPAASKAAKAAFFRSSDMNDAAKPLRASVATSLSAYLRTVTEMTVVSVEQFSYSEFLMSLSDPTAFYALAIPPYDELGALEINPAIAFALVDRMLDRPPELSGEEREVTVFFSDLAGFSTMTEAMTPVEVVALTVLLAVVMAPLAEELFFRGWLYTSLRARFSFVTALTVTSVLFGLAHFEKTGIYALAVMPVGFVLGFVRERTGSVVATIAIHAIYNGAAVLAKLLLPD